MQNESLISFQPKYFFKMVWYTVKKMLFKTFIFCSKVPSECVKCSFRDPRKIKNISRGSCPRTPPTEMCCHFTVSVHGSLRVRNGKASKWVPVQAWVVDHLFTSDPTRGKISRIQYSWTEVPSLLAGRLLDLLHTVSIMFLLNWWSNIMLIWSRSRRIQFLVEVNLEQH